MRVPPNREIFDMLIGRTDRCLSELLEYVRPGQWTLDLADKQTLKHHADDLIGVGNAIKERLGE